VKFPQADYRTAWPVTCGDLLRRGARDRSGGEGTSAEEDPAERVWWRRPGDRDGQPVRPAGGHRRLLGLYGLILTVMGVFASVDAKAKAAGINIDLWAGLVILAGGAVFLLWVRLRPPWGGGGTPRR
jgi:hypothetical protein